MTLIDSNVLLDVLTADQQWAKWSRYELDAALLRGQIYINDIVYAELSIRYATVAELDEAMALAGIQRRPMPAASLFLAGKIFRKYRQNGGTRPSLLPDFFIGAQAAVEGLVLLTRDARRYRTYFPGVQLITPT